jgi:thiamine-monophosphate kinase
VEGTIAELGEFGLIDLLTGVLGTAQPSAGGSVLVGPGDDSAVVDFEGARIVISTDAMVEDVHFKRSWSSGEDVGVRAAAANLADIVAMGATPTVLVVALGVPPELQVEWVLELARGLRQEADRLGVRVVGGDVVQSPVVSLAVTALGTLGADEPVRRSGARVGDVVAVCGRLGWAAAGLAVLMRGFRSPRAVVDAHRRPSIDYDAVMRARDIATSMCDVSDGLVSDAGHVAHASGVRLALATHELPPEQALLDVGAALGEDPLSWILTGGDDHAVLATFPASVALPSGWRAVGVVEAGDGVTVDGKEYALPGGHAHFSD